jgi:hypothetical protein
MFDSTESAPAAPWLAKGEPVAKKGRPAAKPERVEEIPGQADRLRRLWTAYDFPTAAAFARFLDIPLTTYNSFENGAPISRRVVFRICERMPGITSDWLYFGKSDGLPFEVLRRLGLLDPPGKRRT